jgi:hypothetical protein
LDAYFSNYWDNTSQTQNQLEEKQKQEDAQKDVDNTHKEIVINVEEELAKYGDVSNDNDDNDDNDDEDDFEKI